MGSQDLSARVQGKFVDELADCASLWADLLNVAMTLHSRREVAADAAHLFIRRALWEAAVISYGRTAKTGRRLRLADLISAQGVDAERCHRDVIVWRDRHVAHRVDRLRETVEIRAMLDPAERRLKRLNVRVAPALGPEDEADDLAQRLEAHVEALRESLWQRMRELEQKVIDAYAGRVEELLANAEPLAKAAGFAIDIDPTGRT